MTKENNVALSFVLKKLIIAFATEESMKDLGKSLKNEGLDIVEEILQKLRQEQQEEVIKNYVKQRIKDTLLNVMLYSRN
jgi:hypothetical protein